MGIQYIQKLLAVNEKDWDGGPANRRGEKTSMLSRKSAHKAGREQHLDPKTKGFS